MKEHFFYNPNTITNVEVNEQEQEILKAVKNLKNNKSPGTGNILNVQIKASVNEMLPIYKKPFNIIFNKGIVQKN